MENLVKGLEVAKLFKGRSKSTQFGHADWFVGALMELAIVFLRGVTDFLVTRGPR